MSALSVRLHADSPLVSSLFSTSYKHYSSNRSKRMRMSSLGLVSVLCLVWLVVLRADGLGEERFDLARRPRSQTERYASLGRSSSRFREGKECRDVCIECCELDDPDDCYVNCIPRDCPANNAVLTVKPSLSVITREKTFCPLLCRKCCQVDIPGACAEKCMRPCR